MSCIRFLLFLCGCSLVRVTTRWWTLMVASHLHPLCLGESVFPWVFFRCCPLRSFPCALVPQGLPPWGVVVQGNSVGVPFFARYPWVTFSLSAVASPSPVFGGGGERENILYQLLLCTAVTLTIDLIYDFPVTVGRMFTCVLDGFSDLIMLAWAFRAVLFILLGLRV